MQLGRIPRLRNTPSSLNKQTYTSARWVIELTKAYDSNCTDTSLLSTYRTYTVFKNVLLAQHLGLAA